MNFTRSRALSQSSKFTLDELVEISRGSYNPFELDETDEEHLNLKIKRQLSQSVPDLIVKEDLELYADLPEPSAEANRKYHLVHALKKQDTRNFACFERDADDLDEDDLIDDWLDLGVEEEYDDYEEEVDYLSADMSDREARRKANLARKIKIEFATPNDRKVSMLQQCLPFMFRYSRERFMTV